MEELAFLYDKDCGFCEWCSQWLQRIATCPVQPAALGENAEYGSELGHRAIGTALRDTGRWEPTRLVGRILLFKPLSPVFAGIYRLVANNRHKLGPLVGKDACSL